MATTKDRVRVTAEGRVTVTAEGRVRLTAKGRVKVTAEERVTVTVTAETRVLVTAETRVGLRVGLGLWLRFKLQKRLYELWLLVVILWVQLGLGSVLEPVLELGFGDYSQTYL